ncbi:MAG: FAD-binding protein [Methylocystis sp.]
MTTLLLAETAGDALAPATAKALTAAKDIGGPIHILVAGPGLKGAADQAGKLAGVEKVLYAEDAALDHVLAETVAALIVSLAGAYDVIIAPSTSATKNVLPRVAALLDVMQVSDIVKVVSADTFERPIYAGNALQTVRAKDAKKVITVRTTAFAPTPEGGSAPVEDRGAGQPGRVRLQTRRAGEIRASRAYVGAGRSVGRPRARLGGEFSKSARSRRDAANAAIGASRAAVDAGYAPNDLQVGQTGKAVAPDLYIAAGISGRSSISRG